MGEHDRLREARMLFQYATVKEFVEPVEEITGRTVRSFISGLDSQEGVAAEMFVFYPRGGRRGERSGNARRPGGWRSKIDNGALKSPRVWSPPRRRYRATWQSATAREFLRVTCRWRAYAGTRYRPIHTGATLYPYPSDRPAW